LTTTTSVLRPFVRDYPGEPVPEETFTHPPFWSSSNLHQLLPSITIHSVLPVQTMCLTIFLHNLSPHPLWSTSSWFGALHLTFHTKATTLKQQILQELSSCWDGRPFGHNRHGPKSTGLLCPFRGRAGSPCNTMCPGPRPTSIPSGIV